MMLFFLIRSGVVLWRWKKYLNLKVCILVYL